MKNRLLSISATGFSKNPIAFHKFVGMSKFIAAAVAAGAASVAVPVGLVRLFLSFLKIGSVIFGSGYVLLAFLQTEFVERLHWLSEKQLIDAVAVGQFTPGPLSATATFIGFIVAGWPGAVVATVGIFLPGFSLALMAVVAMQLGRTSIVDRTTLIVFIASLIALLWLRVNSAWVVVGAAVVGWLMW